MYVGPTSPRLSIGRVNPPNAEAGDVERSLHTLASNHLGVLTLLNAEAGDVERNVHTLYSNHLGVLTLPMLRSVCNVLFNVAH